MAERILVPVDGSPLSTKAFERAVREAGETVIALHVIDPSDPGYSTPEDVDVTTEPLHGSEEWYERARAKADDLFEDLRDATGGSEVTIETASTVGDPGRSIVEYAERHDVDEIFIGSHGREGETNLMIGQTAELVAARSPVSVTIIR